MPLLDLGALMRSGQQRRAGYDPNQVVGDFGPGGNVAPQTPPISPGLPPPTTGFVPTISSGPGPIFSQQGLVPTPQIPQGGTPAAQNAFTPPSLGSLMAPQSLSSAPPAPPAQSAPPAPGMVSPDLRGIKPYVGYGMYGGQYIPSLGRSLTEFEYIDPFTGEVRYDSVAAAATGGQ